MIAIHQIAETKARQKIDNKKTIIIKGIDRKIDR